MESKAFIQKYKDYKRLPYTFKKKKKFFILFLFHFGRPEVEVLILLHFCAFPLAVLIRKTD